MVTGFSPAQMLVASVGDPVLQSLSLRSSCFKAFNPRFPAPVSHHLALEPPAASQAVPGWVTLTAHPFRPSPGFSSSSSTHHPGTATARPEGPESRWGPATTSCVPPQLQGLLSSGRSLGAVGRAGPSLPQR